MTSYSGVSTDLWGFMLRHRIIVWIYY